MRTYLVAENIEAGETHTVQADEYRYNAETALIEFWAGGFVIFAIPTYLVKWIKLTGKITQDDSR